MFIDFFRFRVTSERNSYLESYFCVFLITLQNYRVLKAFAFFGVLNHYRKSHTLHSAVYCCKSLVWFSSTYKFYIFYSFFSYSNLFVIVFFEDEHSLILYLFKKYLANFYRFCSIFLFSEDFLGTDR